MNKNKIILVLLILASVFNSSPLLAQKCYLTLDEKDPFSGERKRMYKLLFAGGKPVNIWEIQFNQLGPAYTLTISAFLKGRNPVSVAEGTIVYLKLEDNTIMQFKVDKEVPPIYTSTYGDKTRWDLKFNLTEDQLKKFAASPLTTLKVNINSQELYCQELAGKADEKIIRGAGCMLLKD